jgi:hypothetical protein
MKTLYAPRKFHLRLVGLVGAFLLLLSLGTGASAQSTDQEYPTPIRTGEISGTITPRDLGDPRLTRYFYLFTGTPGDLIVTVESENLEGGVDVFTAGVMRPLANISLYAGINRSGGSKTIYLRTRESLILRVEARTPNDNTGSFRVRFEGTFEPIGSEVPDPEPVVPTISSTSSTSKNARRVTATGARIDEPEPEPSTTTQPDTSAANTPGTPSTEPSATETPATTAEATPPETPKPRTPRNRRSRTPRNTRTTRPAPTIKRTPTPAEPAEPSTAAAEAASGPRLIIETKDGMRIERYMTTVRRVTVERGLLVVITTDGKVERRPMDNVLRMAIEP